MKTAVVHDWLNGMRGGEKVLEAILPLVPEPTIFTLFHVPGSVSPAIERHPIVPSFLNRLPFARRGYRNYLPLFPRAVESFDLSDFDLVVSSSHCVAKGAVARPGAPHLSYCHTPVRYAYEQFDVYFPRGRTRLRALKKAAVARLRAWDLATGGRPTRYLANSSAVAERIRRHYGREASVCPSARGRGLLFARGRPARRLPARGRRARALQAVRGRDRGRAPVRPPPRPRRKRSGGGAPAGDRGRRRSRGLRNIPVGLLGCRAAGPLPHLRALRAARRGGFRHRGRRGAFLRRTRRRPRPGRRLRHRPRRRDGRPLCRHGHRQR